MDNKEQPQILNFPVFVQILDDSKKEGKKGKIFQKKTFVEELADYINKDFELKTDQMFNCTEPKKWHDGSYALIPLQKFLNEHSNQLKKFDPFFEIQLEKINKKTLVDILEGYLFVDKIEYPEQKNILATLDKNNLAPFLSKLFFVAVTRGENRKKDQVKRYDGINRARIKFVKEEKNIVAKTRKKYIIGIVGLVIVFFLFVAYHFYDKKERQFVNSVSYTNMAEINRSSPVLFVDEKKVFYNGDIYKIVDDKQKFIDQYKNVLSLKDTEKSFNKVFSCTNSKKEKYITLADETNTKYGSYYYETSVENGKNILVSRYTIIADSSFPQVELISTEKDIIKLDFNQSYELDSYFSEYNEMLTPELAEKLSQADVFVNKNNIASIAKNQSGSTKLKLILVSKENKSNGRFLEYRKNKDGKYDDNTDTDFYPITIKYTYE